MSTSNLAPVHLVSLYDLHYLLNTGVANAAASSPDAYRFLDSGGYETAEVGDVWELDGPPAHQPWSRDLYVEAANAFAREGDVLISHDAHSLPFEEQISSGRALFDLVAVSGLQRSLLIHPRGASAREVAEAVLRLASDIDIIGLTEKDIGPPWFSAAKYLRQLRIALDAGCSHYVPIHVFGCFDPQTIPHLFFAGADIFDGLSWMRYYFHDDHAYYAKEYEYALSSAALLDAEGVAKSLLANNVEQLERLRADLRYTVLTGDVSRFEPFIRTLQTVDFRP